MFRLGLHVKKYNALIMCWWSELIRHETVRDIVSYNLLVVKKV